MRPVTEYLRDTSSWLHRTASLRAPWLAFIRDLEAAGALDLLLDEDDGRQAALAVFIDLGSNLDGSHFLRWRAELLLSGAPECVCGAVNDPPAVAGTLERIARIAATAEAAP